MLALETGSTLPGAPGTSAAAAPASPGTSAPPGLTYVCAAKAAGDADASSAPLLKLRPAARQPPLAQRAAATGLTPLLNSSGLPSEHAAAENCRPLVLATPGASAHACSTARTHARSSRERCRPSIACSFNHCVSQGNFASRATGGLWFIARSPGGSACFKSCDREGRLADQVGICPVQCLSILGCLGAMGNADAPVPACCVCNCML